MIVSVSRRTDIPAFYTPWFLRRLHAGEVYVRSPYRPHQISRIPLSLETVDAFVFWSKNPAPLLPHLPLLSAYPFYIQYTLTPYDKTLEPGIPSVSDAVRTFQELAGALAPGQVVWRYDPILLTQRYTQDFHIEAFSALCRALTGKTDLCVVSFLDSYPSIQGAIKKHGIQPVPYPVQIALLEQFSAIAAPLGISLRTCAEAGDLPVPAAACIDPVRLRAISGRRFFAPKAKGQRPECGCCESVDIGAYHSCPGGCVYCYANQGRSPQPHTAHDPNGPLLFGVPAPEDQITDRAMPCFSDHQLSMF